MKPTDYMDGTERFVTRVPAALTLLMLAVLIGVGIAQ